MTITVFGSANLDLTVGVEAMPVAGATIHAKDYRTGLGGKGANQAIAAHKMAKDPVRFVAAIGEDSFGDQLVDALSSEGLALDHLVRRADSGTGIAVIHLDAGAQNMISVVGGANLSWPDTGPDPSVFAGAKVALFQLETPLAATLSAMKAAKEAGAIVILDPAPMPADTESLRDFLSLADIVTPNETEAAGLVGFQLDDFDGALGAGRKICAMGCAAAVLKLGSRGLAYVTTANESGVLTPFKVNAIDTVAAGDSFNGGLAAALAEGNTLEAALRFASAAGALATTRRGASAAVPSRNEVDALIALEA
ncbi:ribokinase [uncultured Cohaesibacter sp.]|uniref:ribokinase n=1 Tax=uncultured Cohaesibacter sp. TaxID=1002546 RepID=UPI002AAB9423|nr:ribokinase [uncultured Cohaesibacter sp.]